MTIFTLSVQINRVFPIDSVLHLLSARQNVLKQLTRYEYGTIEAFNLKIEPTRTPQYVIISLESGRMHYFLHDNDCICRCMWDGNVCFDAKKEIAMDMMAWWRQEHALLDHQLVNFKDNLVFSQVVASLNPTKSAL